ncbi:MAG: hypothetical protein ACLQOO_10925 [Terriglobia bacterium]
MIDASVAVISKPLQSRRLAFLREVLTICYRFVATDEIDREWKNHATSLARQWQASMVARRKRVPFKAFPDASLRAAISRIARTDGDREAMLKDTHLIEAALQARSPIVSTDDTARDLFRGVAPRIPRLKNVVWVNPVRAEEKALEWLKEGAKADPARRLGAGQEA